MASSVETFVEPPHITFTQFSLLVIAEKSFHFFLLVYLIFIHISVLQDNRGKPFKTATRISAFDSVDIHLMHESRAVISLEVSHDGHDKCMMGYRLCYMI